MSSSRPVQSVTGTTSSATESAAPTTAAESNRDTITATDSSSSSNPTTTTTTPPSSTTNSSHITDHHILRLSSPPPSSSPSASSPSPSPPVVPPNLIINVWSDNLRIEMRRLGELVDRYPYIGMDTEFPGLVARPVGSFKSTTDYHYATLKCNVDLLKLIQFGLCFCDEHGNLIPDTSVWQFNFQFDLNEDMFADDSIQMLRACGLDFPAHAVRGIDPMEFAELLITSGIVLNEEIRWISFHASYDFAYLLKILTVQRLPNEEAEFFDLLQIYFPHIYDLKYLASCIPSLNGGGLQRMAEHLQLERVGQQHQAGSDSLLTSALFFKMKQQFFEDQLPDEKYTNILYGLGSQHKLKQMNASGFGEKTSLPGNEFSNLLLPSSSQGGVLAKHRSTTEL